MKSLDPFICVVEDDNFFAEMVKESLRQSNFEKVKLYGSGEQLLQNMINPPDVVILDHNLGKMNGIEVLRELKGINPNIQVIFLSAQERMTVAISSLKYGAYDYLEKTDDGLQKLSYLIKRIVLTNKLLNENRRHKVFMKLFWVGMFVLVSLLINLMIF